MRACECVYVCVFVCAAKLSFVLLLAAVQFKGGGEWRDVTHRQHERVSEWEEVSEAL